MGVRFVCPLILPSWYLEIHQVNFIAMSQLLMHIDYIEIKYLS